MSVLHKLSYESGRIFDVELTRDKKRLRFTEACDLYYDCDLSKEEVIELAGEFIKLADQMISEREPG